MHLHFEKYVICSSQESIRKSHSICIYPNQIVLVVALFFMPLYGRDKSLPRMLLHFSPVNNTNIKKSSMQWPKTTTKYNPPPKKKKQDWNSFHFLHASHTYSHIASASSLLLLESWFSWTGGDTCNPGYFNVLSAHYIALLLRAIGGALLQIGTEMFHYYSLLSYRSPAVVILIVDHWKKNSCYSLIFWWWEPRILGRLAACAWRVSSIAYVFVPTLVVIFWFTRFPGPGEPLWGALPDGQYTLTTEQFRPWLL
jgi:hypothetical protein